jgi:hypothetical protein
MDSSTEYKKHKSEKSSEKPDETHEQKRLRKRAGTVWTEPTGLGGHATRKSWKGPGKKKKPRSGSIKHGVDPKTGKPVTRVLGGFATRPRGEDEESEY